MIDERSPPGQRDDLIVKTKPFVLESAPLVTNEFRKRLADATLRENQTSKSLVVH
jgi:hypothetical protein